MTMIGKQFRTEEFVLKSFSFLGGLTCILIFFQNVNTLSFCSIIFDCPVKGTDSRCLGPVMDTHMAWISARKAAPKTWAISALSDPFYAYDTTHLGDPLGSFS